MSALLTDNERLRDLGYESDLCLTDLEETAERTVEDKLSAKAYDCVLIGVGIRVIPSSFWVGIAKRRSSTCGSEMRPPAALRGVRATC
jgi:hypothetical protein